MSIQVTDWLEAINNFPALYPLVFLITLMIGSFLNVVILRTPKILENDFRQECCELLELQNKFDQRNLSLSFPLSNCPKCGTTIKPWHNIPVISYLALKGKCNYCSTPISIRYPLIELTTALLSTLTIYLLGFTYEGLSALLLLWLLITLTVIDIDTYLLPDNLTLPLLWLGLLVNCFSLHTDIISAIWGAMAGYLTLWSIYWLFKLVTGKEGMGYGDFKLLAALGAWMGWQSLPLIILLSSLVGAIIGIAGIMILGRDKNIPIPFGPYLAIAGWIAFLWGDQIVDAYLSSLTG